MKGTVAPPSSSSTAARTCPSRTPSSSAMRRWIAACGADTACAGVSCVDVVTFLIRLPRRFGNRFCPLPGPAGATTADRRAHPG